MESARWKKISALYHQAGELEGEAREQFLADACKGDDDLRREAVCPPKAGHTPGHQTVYPDTAA